MRSSAVIFILIATFFSVESQDDENGITIPSGVSVNPIFDFIMGSIGSNVSEFQNYTTVPIPDFVQKFQTKLGLIKVTASLTATNGTLSGLTTLHRVGDVIMSMADNGTVYFKAAVALNPLRVVFRNYTLQVSFLRKSGDLLALDVRKNSFNAIFMARFENSNCQMVLEKIEIKELANVKVDLTGFSIFNPIGNKLAEWFIYFFNNFILKITETYAKEMVNHIIQNSDICNKFLKSGILGIMNNVNRNTSHRKPSDRLEEDNLTVNPETNPQTHISLKEEQRKIPELEHVHLLDWFELMNNDSSIHHEQLKSLNKLNIV